jgi:hypothetical protein
VAHLVLTELRPTGSLFAGKKILRDNSIEQAPKIKNWFHRRVEFDNIDEFFEYVCEVQYDNAIIVRGLTEATDEKVYRRKQCNEKPENVFRDFSAALLPLDIDDIAVPEAEWKKDPKQAVDEIVKRLGPPFSETSYVAQLTGTHGLVCKVNDKEKHWTGEIGGDVMSVRIFFMTMRGLSAPEAETWLEHLRYGIPVPEIDPVLGRLVQIIYLARPKWHGHARRDDPLGDLVPCWLVERQFGRLPVPNDLPQRTQQAAQTGHGHAVAQHPDAATAVASIGLPLNGGDGRGVIYEHLKSAAVHMIAANPLNGMAIGRHAVALRDSLAAMCDAQRDRIVENLVGHQRGDDWVLMQGYLRDDIPRWIVWWLDHIGSGGKRKKVRRRRPGELLVADEMRSLRGARGDDNLIGEFTEIHDEAYLDKYEATKTKRKEERTEREQQHAEQAKEHAA